MAPESKENAATFASRANIHPGREPAVAEREETALLGLSRFGRHTVGHASIVRSGQSAPKSASRRSEEPVARTCLRGGPAPVALGHDPPADSANYGIGPGQRRATSAM